MRRFHLGSFWRIVPFPIDRYRPPPMATPPQILFGAVFGHPSDVLTSPTIHKPQKECSRTLGAERARAEPSQTRRHIGRTPDMANATTSCRGRKRSETLTGFICAQPSNPPALQYSSTPVLQYSSSLILCQTTVPIIPSPAC